MGAIALNKAEQALFEAVEHGERRKCSGGDRIHAEVLRHIIMGLPLVSTGVGPLRRERACVRTGAGIWIVNAVIEGRLPLDGATGEDGGAICPLQFENCCFEGGFSGENTQFSRLSFEDCRFQDEPGGAPSTRPTPTINLAGARFETGVTMCRIVPNRPTDHLWIRGPDIFVPGKLDLSGSKLRAPPDDPAHRPNSEPPIVAIDVSRAEIRGDLAFLGRFESEGAVWAQGTRVEGDVRMSGASIKIASTHDKFGINLQSAVIRGMVILDSRPAVADRDAKPVDCFRCTGEINLRAVEIGDDLHIAADQIAGDLNGLDAVVGNDVLLYASFEGMVNLSGCRIGGTLDLSRLSTRSDNSELLLNNGSIQRVLSLVRDDYEPGEQDVRSNFQMRGTADLSGLRCETLEDDVGRAWGRHLRMHMHNFTYRQTGKLPEKHRKKRSNRIVGEWILRRRADGLLPWRWVPGAWLPDTDFWEPWQSRRDWIYQQFESDAIDAALADPTRSLSLHEIDEEEYHPQPFEQAIRVARAEGREDFANQFEILKERIEWRFFNETARWGLSFIGIGLAALWLMIKRDSLEWTIWVGLAAAVTIALMVNTSKIHNFYKRLVPHKADETGSRRPTGKIGGFVARALTWLTYFVPPALLYVHGTWMQEPYYFVMALLIYAAVRFVGIFAHAVMRFCFGYLRRPLSAIGTLIAAFLIGWWAVHLANTNEMLVVDAAPVASLVGPEADETGARKEGRTLLFMGSQDALGNRRLVRDVPCSHLISEPLYALDVLVPLLDLREESRCEVRRTSERGKVPPRPEEMRGLWGVVTAVPALTLHNAAFWQVMKVLYAVAGWFIVSLSILTFAQATRTHAEPPTEPK